MLQKTNEHFHQQNIYQYGPKRSIMIWAAISADGKSDIIRLNENVTARRYMAEAVKPGIMPFVNRHNRPMTFATRGWLASWNIPIFGPWSSKSPDMNLIKNLWAKLQRTIDNRPNRPQNEVQQCRAVPEGEKISSFWISRASSFRCVVDAQPLHKLLVDTLNIKECLINYLISPMKYIK